MSSSPLHDRPPPERTAAHHVRRRFMRPGPGVAALLLGLLILSTEVRWAHRLLKPARTWARQAEQYAERRKDDYMRRRRERKAAKGRTYPNKKADPGPGSI